MTWAWLMVVVAAPLPPTAPPPAWVEAVDVPKPVVASTEPVVMLLRDTQIRAGAGPREWFEHHAWQVQTLKGIAELAQQQFVWEPTYEKLTLHGAWIWRNGVRRVAWDPDDARVLQRESGLDQGIYDGRQTLILELRDLRVGDIVEIASTVTGDNPVFEGRVSFSANHGVTEPLVLSRLRVRWEGKRPLQVASLGGAPKPESTTVGEVTTFRLEQKDVKPVDYELGVPNDILQSSWLTFSDWESWAEVAAWGARTFAAPAGGARLETELERLKRLPENARLEAIVRFVQDDVRYVGVELGMHSHRPHTVDWVLERGFGDCKDKAQLLVTLFRGLGLEAWPMVVNSDQGGLVPQSLPSPSAFDHAIVKVVLPDGPRFIDATMTLKRGKIATNRAPAYGWGLTLDEKTSALEELPLPKLDEPTWELRQTWNEGRGAPSSLEVVVTARGSDAARLRRLVVNAAFKEERRQDRERDFDTKLELIDVTLSDDEAAEAVSLIENYRVKNFWELEDHDFGSVMLGWHLGTSSEDRKLPLELEYPLRVKEVVVWNSSEELKPYNFNVKASRYEHPAFELQVTESINRHQLRLEWELQHRKDRVLTEELSAFRETSKRALDAMTFSVSKGGRPRRGSGIRTDDGWSFGGIACLVVGLLVGVLIFSAPRIPEWLASGKAKWRTSRFLAKQRSLPGETAASAAVVPSLEAGRSLFTSRSCPRGHAAWLEAVPGEGVRLGDERIHVLSRRCQTCDAREDRYLKVTLLS